MSEIFWVNQLIYFLIYFTFQLQAYRERADRHTVEFSSGSKGVFIIFKFIFFVTCSVSSVIGKRDKF